MIRCLAWAAALVFAMASPVYADEIVALTKKVAAAPDDVDARLRLAIALSHQGDHELAKGHANKVLDRAPRYWDAHVLLARIDAWEGRYEPARARLRKVREQDADYLPALILWADIAYWSADAGELETTARTLGNIGAIAEMYFRLAQVEFQRHNTKEARRLAKKALHIEAGHAGAQNIARRVRRVWLQLTLQTEHWPRLTGEQAWGYGQIASASFWPGSRLSFVGSYEYHRRFATDNHLWGLQTDWRANKSWTLTGRAVVGIVEVVPALTLSGGFGLAISPHVGVTVGYRYDGLPWPGQIHRSELQVRVEVSRKIAVAALVSPGVLRSCGNTHFVHVSRVEGTWRLAASVTLSMRYSFGNAVDRPPLLPQDCSFPDLLSQATGHFASTELRYSVSQRTLLRLGYGAQFWNTGSRSLLMHLGLGQAF